MSEFRRFLRAIAIPLSLAFVLLVAVLVVFPRLGEPPPERGVSSEEQGWLAGYSQWATATTAAVRAAYAERTAPGEELGPLVGRAEACREQLGGVGAAPSTRFEEVAGGGGQACALAAAAADAFRRNDAGPNLETSQLLGASLNVLVQTDFQLRKLLVLERPLPRAEGASTESRLEPRLGTAASQARGFAEVRCWSADEWPVVRRELDAVGLERDERLARLANANRWLIHLSPPVCTPLVELAYGAAPDSDAERRELAAALLVLAHASEHLAGADRGEPAVADAAAAAVEALAREVGAAPEDAAVLAAHAQAENDASARLTLAG